MGRIAMAWRGGSFVEEALRTFGFSHGDANQDLHESRDVLEGRSRALYQNAQFAGAAVDTKVINVVGTGISAKPIVDSKFLGITEAEASEFNERMKKLFALWAESKEADSECEKNFYQMQELVMKTKAICGDAFALRCWHDVPNSAFGLCYKILEGNRCKNPGNQENTKDLVMGVELNDAGKHIAYYFTKYTMSTKYDVFATGPMVRVEAFDQFGIRNVIQVMKADRPGQHRGVPWLAPIIPFIKNQERYQNSVLLQAIIESMYTVFVKSKSSDSAPEMYGNIPEPERVTPLPGTMPTEGEITSPSFGVQRPSPTPAIELGAGNVVALGQDQEIQVAQHSSPNSNYRDYMHEVNMQMASRLGMSYEQVQKFWSGSYNSVRAALLEAKKMFDVERENLVSDFCQPVYDAFLHECVMLGYVKCPGYDDPIKRMMWHKCQWIGDAPVMLDPAKEVAAYKMMVDEQFATREDVSLAINGSDYYNNVKNLAREQAARAAEGVENPGAVNRSVSVSSVEPPSEPENGAEDK